MSTVLLDPSGVAPSRWRNGAGNTRELAVERDSAGEVLWRISVADLGSSAAFSTFPQTERLFVALGPLRLTVEGTDHVLQAGDQRRFPGEAPVTVLLDAPTRALNVITRRGQFRADVTLSNKQPGAPGIAQRAASAVFTVDLASRTADIRLIRVGPPGEERHG